MVGRRQCDEHCDGGAGGNLLSALGGAGGAATAVDDVRSTGGAVDSTATATGGASGEESGVGGAAHATANADAAGFTTVATATATGGEGETGALAGAAFATAGAIGDIGNISATATSSVGGSSALVTEIESQGFAFAHHSVVGVAQTGFGGSAPSFQSSDAAVALGTATPSAAAVDAVFSANSKIAGVFGSSPDVYALGEIGAAHAASGTEAESSSAVVTVDVNTDNLAANEELTIGFYNGDLKAAHDITSVALLITDNASPIVDQTFATGAAAERYFTDNALGDLLLLSPGGGAADLNIGLTVNTDGPKSGFYGDFIVGGVPNAEASLSSSR